ncbi:hypothetical protein SanaruYs_35700 [Chryseotalea sanaruensis]|uniref:Lipoprotein n=1 Tax=Chryseotalea sanaruensis TaxID=2482724 RepID=A0A401UEN4_9BACT|nr:hypothetical protein [Chryseotalea sanaruensis]GCC53327.1 hypothetical protein SanaruYs_35700 [Chryseotalea sanaruensis]
MKRGITLLILVGFVTSCTSQQINKSAITLELEKNINRIGFSKLSFFTEELIQLATDTSFQYKLKKKLGKHNNVNRKTEGDQREYQLTLYLLYNKLKVEKNYNKEYERGKEFLLDLLSEKRMINFSVDQNLIIQQIDASKRSLINGYDEGTVEESIFTFFCYDPLLYKRTLIKNGLNEDWKRTGLFLCNYLRANENPTTLRNPIKEGILKRLSHKEIQHEFKDIVKDITDCDVSSNLFD